MGAQVAWWCSLAGALVGTGACIAILVGNAAHVAVGVAPVLAWAPLNLILVAVAFGLAAVVAEGVPRLVNASGDRPNAHRARSVAVDVAPVIARCAACGAVFAESLARRPVHRAGSGVAASSPASASQGHRLGNPFTPSAN